MTAVSKGGTMIFGAPVGAGIMAKYPVDRFFHVVNNPVDLDLDLDAVVNNLDNLDNLGDTLAPGNSPGIQTFSPAQTWSSFSYDWEVNNFTGTTAGSDFDQIGLSSTLNLSGGSGSYILNILSLTALNAGGNVPNFSEINRSWTILSTISGITGFNAANWSINTTNFTNTNTGSWGIAQSGNDLVLSYTAVPEPNVTMLLGSMGLLALLRRWR